MSGRARNADEVGDMLRDIDNSHEDEREALEEEIAILKLRILSLQDELAKRETGK